MAAVARYLADTSALSRLDRSAVDAALSPLIEAGQVATCGMVKLEVSYSARPYCRARCVGAWIYPAIVEVVLPTEVGMTNDVNYFEIGSADPETSKTFYGSLFDWNVGEPSMPARYSMVNEDRGGLWDTTQMGGANWAIFYVQVDDVHAAIDRAQELGATVVVPFVDNGRIEFAHLTDPLGNRFGIWHPKTAQ